MYCSNADDESERKVYTFADLKAAYRANCRTGRDWLLYEAQIETEDSEVVLSPSPRRPIAPKEPTRFVRIETELKDGRIHRSKLPVFHFAETRPSPGTKRRTVCKAKLAKLYTADYHRHIKFVEAWESSTGHGGWFTAHFDPDASVHAVSGRKSFAQRRAKRPFGYPEFEAHLKGRAIYGNFVSGATGYCIFDVDFHEPICDIGPCLDVIRLVWSRLPDLMKRLRGYGLHAQLKLKDVDGIHGLFFLRKRLDQKDVEQTVREFSLDLERQHPDVFEARRRCCFPKSDRDRAKIHLIDRIGPNDHNGFRLPFCRGRQMIADDLISIDDGKHDFERFVGWQEECRRQNWTTQNSMKIEDLLDVVQHRFKRLVSKVAISPSPQVVKVASVFPTLSTTACRSSAVVDSKRKEEKKEEEWVYSSIRLVSPTKDSKTCPSDALDAFSSAPERRDKLIWKGRAKQIIVETFTGQLLVPGSLDEISCFLARIATEFNASNDEATERFRHMLGLIPPDVAPQLSSRLAKGDHDQIAGAFRQKLDRAANGKLRLPDETGSTKTLGQCVQWWKRSGFNPFEPKTWNHGHPLHRREIRDIWNAHDKMDFCDALLPQLGRSTKWVDPVHLVNVCLYWVRRKEKEENGMALGYWRAMLEGEMNIPCGDNGVKRHQKIKNALIDLGVIEQAVGPMFGRGRGMATRYAPGCRARERGGFLSAIEMESMLSTHLMTVPA